jgi:protein-disulfide isomerase
MKGIKFFSLVLGATVVSIVAIVAYLSASYFGGGIIQISNHQANAAETGEQIRAENNNNNSNVSNGFSPINSNVSKQQATTKLSPNVIANKLSVSNLVSGGSPLLGKASAPITIVEFGDFQCRFCDRFAKETEPQINSTYIQTGKASLVFKNFVTHGSDSVTAAVAAQCAKDQGKFWNFYQTLFNNQGEENSGWASKDNMKRFASQISGLNTQKFNSCLDGGKYNSLVNNDNAFAISSGFQGTPTFIIERNDGTNQETLLGAYPFPAFQAIIDKKISSNTGG